MFNTLRPDIWSALYRWKFSSSLSNATVWTLNKFSLKYVPGCVIHEKAALLQTIAGGGGASQHRRLYIERGLWCRRKKHYMNQCSRPSAVTHLPHEKLRLVNLEAVINFICGKVINWYPIFVKQNNYILHTDTHVCIGSQTNMSWEILWWSESICKSWNTLNMGFIYTNVVALTTAMYIDGTIDGSSGTDQVGLRRRTRLFWCCSLSWMLNTNHNFVIDLQSSNLSHQV